MSIKINTLQVENVKRVKAVALEPSANGLTVIGGKNGQGKTSVLDAIAWALGGDRYRPSNAEREGSTLPPHIKLELSNGLTVERSGKNSALKVVDTTGKRSGQQLLNEFVEQLAIDLPRFLQASNREKADTLLQVIGVGDQVRSLEVKEKEVYNRRHMIGQEADRKRKYADELPHYPAAPNEPVSASQLIRQQQDILARNGENQRKRMRANQIEHEYGRTAAHVSLLRSQLADAEKQLQQLEADLAIAQKDALDLQDESTDEIERSLQEIEQINIQVRANCDREKAEQDAAHYAQQYQDLTKELEEIRHDKYALLDSAKLPLPGLSVEDGELTYNGKKWDCMSGADQLIAATAIVRAINPKCGFVLLDKLEQLDADQLHMFGVWLQSQQLQVIATRVSTGPECSIIIEDGFVASEQPAAQGWQKGVF
nr:MAG TPA: STRUCTURAL MAINTENANCE OF CHROMOSOMES PROTEIN [Caudoviricetes sp.]